MADIATGLTITAPATSWTAEIVSLTINGRSVPVLDSSHMLTTVARTKLFGDLRDEQDITLTIHFDPDKPAPVGGAGGGTKETAFVITFRTPDGQSGGATKTGPGAFTNETSSHELETIMSSTVTFTWSGEVTDAVSTP